jgi:hypothetical protein
VLVLAAAAKPVVLLGEIRELEIDAERSQDERLAFQLEPGHALPQLLAARRSARRARIAREETDALLLVEQLLPFLLDEDAAEDVAQKTDVPAEWGVRGIATFAAHAEDSVRPDLGAARGSRGRR